MEQTQNLLSYLPADWKKFLADELQAPYMEHLLNFVEEEYEKAEVYPPKELIFNAFIQCPVARVQVVLVGQDPYHGKGQAHGLCFSVAKGVPPPPSLQNIFKEMMDDVKVEKPRHGCLLSWAQQGVLMLNATLTVRAGKPKSHYGQGWERFTDSVLKKLSERNEPLIFVLWGKSAQEKCAEVLTGPNMKRHFVLTAAHPSPYSASNGFFGCHHFSKINGLLAKQGKMPIDWALR